MATGLTNRGKMLIASEGMPASGATYKAALYGTQVATATAEDWNFLSEISGTTELTGYTRPTLAGLAVVEDDTNNRAAIDCNDIAFTNVTGTPAWMVIFKDGAADNSRPIMAFYDLSGIGALSAGAITVTVNDLIRLA